MTIQEERVARGAAHLDNKVPGWYNKIDLNKLDISSLDVCILCQLRPMQGFTHTSIEFLGNRCYEVAEFGFDITLEEEAVGERAEIYTMLTNAWKNKILNRRYPLTVDDGE